MKAGRMLFCLFAAAVLACGCSSGTDPDADVTDTAVNDAKWDSSVADHSAEVMADSDDDSGDAGPLDVQAPDSEPGDAVVDPDVPEILPITVTGSFRFDYVATESSTIDHFVTLDDADRRTVAVNECGTMGLVFTDRYLEDGYTAALVLSEVDLASPPDIDSLTPRRVLLTRTDADGPPEMTASIVYDGCTPIVFVKTATGYDFAVIGEGDVVWTAVDSAVSYADILHFGALEGRDDRIHLIFRAKPGSDTTKWVDAAYNGSGFDVTRLTNPDTAMASPVDVAIDGDGDMVIGYVKAGVSASEFWIAFSDGTTWQKEQVPGVVPTDIGLSFAIGSYDREGVAWAQTVESDDKILLSVALKYTYRTTDDTFRTDIVAVDNDGYKGGGGTRFTGGHPVLTIDGTGRPHIIWSDIAVSSSGTAQTATYGQVRYGWRRGDTWNLGTILRQDSPDTDNVPSVAFMELGLNGDGTMGGVAALTVAVDGTGAAALDTLGAAIRNIP